MTHDPERGGVRTFVKGEGVGVPSPETLERRASEIAVINGRKPEQATREDWARARDELRDVDVDEKLDQDASDQIISSNPGDPAAFTGGSAPTRHPMDGQTIQEREVLEGMGEAEHERRLTDAESEEET